MSDNWRFERQFPLRAKMKTVTTFSPQIQTMSFSFMKSTGLRMNSDKIHSKEASHTFENLVRNRYFSGGPSEMA